MTVGIERVACWTARTAGVGAAMITSTLERTISAARSGSLSKRPSAYRASILMFLPLGPKVAKALAQGFPVDRVICFRELRQVSYSHDQHLRLRQGGR